jgi:hypothetical protein
VIFLLAWWLIFADGHVIKDYPTKNDCEEARDYLRRACVVVECEWRA